MREIKFRGKRVDNGAWAYGSFHYEEVECEKQSFRDGANNHYFGIDIIPVIEVDDDSSSERLNNYQVDPATVGQFTGLYDKKNKEIYEGDIVNFFNSDVLLIKDCDKHARFLIGGDLLTAGAAVDSEVIGNIHEHPHLLDQPHA